MDRQGKEEPIPAPVRPYGYARLSPDGTKIAVSCEDEENDIWVFELGKGTLTRLTFGPAVEQHPIWTADGKYVLFSSSVSSGAFDGQALIPWDIFRRAADGTGKIEALTQHLEGGYPLSISPDGKSLVFRKGLPRPDLFVLPLDPLAQGHALIADKGLKDSGEISPDGRWLAYSSNNGEGGRNEVYVRPFPAVESGGPWQISSAGGSHPMWSRSGRELFFEGEGALNAVSVPAGPTFTSGKPQRLFAMAPYGNRMVDRSFDISPDGKRFLILKNQISGITLHPSIVVVSHWFDEVKAKMPARK